MHSLEERALPSGQGKNTWNLFPPDPLHPYWMEESPSLPIPKLALGPEKFMLLLKVWLDTGLCDSGG